MCGFSITKNGAYKSIAHRGTTTTKDDWGSYKLEFHSLPLSTHNTNIEQPISVGRFKMVFNGEIFNYQDLSKRHCKSDLHYLAETLQKSKTIEAFYNASLQWDGFWSIAIYEKDHIWFFTDWLGKKQLYFSKQGIASEMKAILPDEYWLHDYGPKQYLTNNTPFTGVYRAIPGVLYGLETNWAVLPYTALRQQYRILEPYSDFYQVIDRSIKQRLENRLDGVTMLLSGGLDSNIILHHIKDLEPEILTIENGESEIVEQVMDEYSLNARYVSDFVTEEDWEDAVYHYEYPYDLGSLLPNFLLFKEATNSMVLTGDGADELFGGYRRASARDTLQEDIMELQYYHNIRIDRTSMAWTKEARSPLMSMPLARIALRLPRAERMGKRILRHLYKDKLPKVVTQTKKKPLRLDDDKHANWSKCKQTFIKIYSQKNP